MPNKKILAVTLSLFLQLLAHQSHGQHLTMRELLGKWVSRFENDSMILEFTDIARVTWGVPKKSGKLKNIKCE